MATVVVRVRGLTAGTLNHIDGLSDDIWVEWPGDGDSDSCPQIVGKFDEVDDGVVVLKWKQEDGAKGWVGIPVDHVEAIITVKGGFETREEEEEDEDYEEEDEDEAEEEEYELYEDDEEDEDEE
jgi:hypothetical protein